MINLVLLAKPVSRIAFVSILYLKLRVASPTCLTNKELLPLPVLELHL